MENLWKRFFGDTSLAKPYTEEWAPTVDIFETEDNYIVKAELPGLEAKDVDVTLTDDFLTIKGEKKNEEEEKYEDRLFKERFYGAFQRSFQLPSGVEADMVEANFDKGVLKIVLPKKEETKKKQIEVKVN
jgi:HSP20 family protein